MSTLGSVLMHFDDSARMPERLQVARLLIRDFGAEVACRPCSTAETAPGPFVAGSAAPFVRALEEAEQAQRRRLHAVFVAHGGGVPGLHWVEPDTASPWAFARHALYADLLLLGQRDHGDPQDRLPADFIPDVLLQSGRPALVLPYAGEVGTVGRTVLVAWNESRESARALAAAQPWLQRAARVHAVVYGEGAELPLARLRHHLLAHRVAEPVVHAGGAASDVGSRLLSMAADVGADLLVMGCYGHSRAREWIMGGATRTILDTMTLPVLLAH